MPDIKLARHIIHQALSRGATASECYAVMSHSTRIDVRHGEVDTFLRATDVGMGLRVLKGDRLGFAYTSEIYPGSLEEMVTKAIAAADGAALDEFQRLPSPFPDYPEVQGGDTGLPGISIEEKIGRARALEASARAYDRRVTKVRHATYSDVRHETLILNSLGLEAGFSGTHCAAVAYVVAEEGGEAQAGFEMDISRFYRALLIEEVGRKAAEKAVRMLKAKGVDTCRAEVVLDPMVAAELLGVLSGALGADAVQKGKSLFAGKVGQAVASSVATLIDDGFGKGVFPAPCDGEGVPSQRTVLLERGVLQGFLHNSYTAAKEGRASTGNARRRSYQIPPEVGPSNIYLEPGTIPREKLIAGVERGLYVASAMGMHTANPVSGDFSVGVEGFWIQGGQLAFPVRGVTIAGNLMDLLQGMAAVANDLRFYGRTGSPTLLVEGLTIGGR
ncbi:MAG: TldD/PmbA family protein [candidate division NC10 bacterium]|nr:TldD/PmbA family protein [candidate division NC10 bacterium]